MPEIKTEGQDRKKVRQRLLFPIISGICIGIFLLFLASTFIIDIRLRISDRLFMGIVLLIASCLILILLLIFQESALKWPIRVYYSIVAVWVLIFIAGGALVLGAMLPSRTKFSERLLSMIEMKKLEIVLDDYARRYGGRYPEPYRWCDLLIEKLNVPREFFISGSSASARCHYGLNPNCEPNSPDDVVLLFEARGRWNICGGPELMSFDNHSDGCCNVLLNDGEVICVHRKDARKLNWGKED